MNGLIDVQGRALLIVLIRAEPDAVASPAEVWIDTGFTGELVMPRSQIDRMGLKPGADGPRRSGRRPKLTAEVLRGVDRLVR